MVRSSEYHNFSSIPHRNLRKLSDTTLLMLRGTSAVNTCSPSSHAFSAGRGQRHVLDYWIIAPRWYDAPHTSSYLGNLPKTASTSYCPYTMVWLFVRYVAFCHFGYENREQHTRGERPSRGFRPLTWCVRSNNTGDMSTTSNFW